MVNTRSMKSSNMIDNVTYDCNVVIRIHKDALIEIDKKSHAVPIAGNDMNIRLRLISAESDIKLAGATAGATRKSKRKDSSPPTTVQFYKPASAIIIKSVARAWVRCKKSKQNVQVRDLVMAKLSGHPAWPSVVLEFLPKQKARVEFLGVEPHERFGSVNLSEIVLFKDSIDILQIQLRKKINRYQKAVMEAEIYAEIPEKHSVFNQLHELQ